MPKQFDLPPEVAHAFVRNMWAYFAEKDPAKQELIAVLQLRTLQDHWRGELRLSDVKAMFERMHAELDN
jgi:hypothetical protein